MKKLLLASLVAVSFAAHAHNTTVPPVVVVSPPVISSSAHQTQHQAQHQKQRQKQHQSQHQNSNSTSTVNSPSTSSTSDANNAAQSTSINYERQAATAFAPSIPPTVNCASSFGAGAQGASFGISFGGTPINVECERRELARTAMNFGDRATAEEVLCGNDDYKAARQRAGRPCAKEQPTTIEQATYTGNDPIVKRRLGLK